MRRARMLKPVLIAGMEQGGQLMITTDVENYPGFADPIQGPWLMEQMLQQAKHVGAEIVNDIVTEVDMNRCARSGARPTAAGLDRRRLIIATGAKAKWLGIESEQHLPGFRRFGLRHLRRLLLSQQGRDRGRRRQFGRRGSALPVEPRQDGDRRASPRSFPRRKDPAGAALAKDERQGHLGTRKSPKSPALPAKPPMPPSVSGVKLRDTKTGASATCRSTACSWPSAMRRRRAVQGQAEA
jgi:thioredoxin reductase (NADPH)